MDIDFSLSEHITIGIEVVLTTKAQHVVTLATSEDVTLHVTIIYFHMGLTWLVDSFEIAYVVGYTTLTGRATSDGSNLSTTMQTATHHATVHHHIALVNVTLITVSASENVTIVFQSTNTVAFCPRLVVQFLYVFTTNPVVANHTVVEDDIGLAIDGTTTATYLVFTLATTIDVTLDGRLAVVEAIGTIIVSRLALGIAQGSRKVLWRLVFTYADDDVGLTIDITHRSGTDIGIYLSHLASGISL